MVDITFDMLKHTSVLFFQRTLNVRFTCMQFYNYSSLMHGHSLKFMYYG
jgi:hypothetical protein